MKLALFTILTYALLTAISFAAPYGAGWYDTSEYLAGRVAVTVVFPESNGSTMASSENWSDARKATVLSEIQNAMTWWAARDARADLSFVFTSTMVPTGYEPINCNVDPASSPGTTCANGEEDWVKQVMGNMGYTETSHIDRVYHYNNDKRDSAGADWAFTIFVADSYNDGDGKFPDNYFAYAYVGGPYAVLTYDNNGYGITNLDAVIAHETGHVFYAKDEYYSSGCSASARGGYYNTTNGNCENSSGVAPYTCIMRGQIAPYTSGSVCTYSAQMMGWRDSDSDGNLDVTDLPPTAALYAYTPDPTYNDTLTYYGMAHSTSAFPNNNPYTGTMHLVQTGARNNISLNTIADVEYRVDSGVWQSATPRDGAFDQTIDSFTFTVGPLSDATHTIETRAKDNFGSYAAEKNTDTVTVNTSPADDIPYVYDSTGADKTYSNAIGTLSANWGASGHLSGINRYEYAIGSTSGGTQLVAWTSAGAARSVTRSGLSLTEGATYYFAVRAVPNSGLTSAVAASNGQRVDTTSPTARILITSGLPAKAGLLSGKLITTEANALQGAPMLRLAPGCGYGSALSLSQLVSSTWTFTFFVESYHSTGTACFTFSAADAAGNSGSAITAGGSFTIDPAISGASGGSISNSDGTTVTVPAGASSGDIYITISTIPASRTAAADMASPDSGKIIFTDLVREFLARNAAGVPVTSFLKPLRITLGYPDANSDGLIDGDNLRETLGWMYYMDPASGKWEPLDPVVRNFTTNTMYTDVPHFSVYAIRTAGISSSALSTVKTYPNPCYFSKGYKLTITGIPMDAAEPAVHIYNSAGELLRKLEKGSGINGVNTAVWDGRDKNGARAASGIYIYLISASNYGKSSGKVFAVW